jgi:hypothetical protein
MMFRQSSALILFGNRTANIAVQCGVWTGRYSGQFLVGELNRFGKEIEYLAEHLKPKAALNSAEHYLQLTLADDGHGQVHLQGNARDRVGAKTALEFAFEVDRADLAGVARFLITADPTE